eukprot:366160-Chlamydomonas_euryale.AAC.5
MASNRLTLRLEQHAGSACWHAVATSPSRHRDRSSSPLRAHASVRLPATVLRQPAPCSHRHRPCCGVGAVDVVDGRARARSARRGGLSREQRQTGRQASERANLRTRRWRGRAVGGVLAAADDLRVSSPPAMRCEAKCGAWGLEKRGAYYALVGTELSSLAR